MKDIIFILFLLFCNLTQIYSQTDWSKAGDIPFSIRYDEIYFINPDTGWAVNADGAIFKTTNGGDSWSFLFQNFQYFRSVEFINDSVGFVGALSPQFFKTTDRGNNWVDISASIPEPLNGICGMSHVGENIICGVGVWSGPAYFIRSDDQGQNWTFIDLSSFADGMVDCHFINADTGFVAGINNQTGALVLKTTDGGSNWELVFSSGRPNEYVWKLDFLNDEYAFGSIENFNPNDSTFIIKTTDGGNTWSEIMASPNHLDVQGIGFLNQNLGWLGPRNEGLLETKDGGQTWDPIEVLPNINKFFRINDTLIFASGSFVYKYIGEMLTTRTEAGPLPIAHKIDVAPVPFSSELLVSIELDCRTYLILELYNAEGKLIKSIARNQMEAGKHQFDLQFTPLLPVGSYFLSLRTNEGFITKKLIR